MGGYGSSDYFSRPFPFPVPLKGEREERENYGVLFFPISGRTGRTGNLGHSVRDNDRPSESGHDLKAAL